MSLFNSYGSNDQYGQGFPSRWKYAQDKIEELNGTCKLASLLREVLDPREFFNTEYESQKAIDFVNKWLSYDGYAVTIKSGRVAIGNFAGVHF